METYIYHLFPNFQWTLYLQENPDLIKHGIDNEKKAIQHLCDYGFFENRKVTSLETTFQKFHETYFIKWKDLDHDNYPCILVYDSFVDSNGHFQKETFRQYVTLMRTSPFPVYILMYHEEMRMDTCQRSNVFIALNIGPIASPMNRDEFNQIPLVSNHPQHATPLHWNDVYDIGFHMMSIRFPYDFQVDDITKDILAQINHSIDYFCLTIAHYPKILVVCTDFHGYGGASTNCHELAVFFRKRHHTVKCVSIINHEDPLFNDDELFVAFSYSKDEHTFFISCQDIGKQMKNILSTFEPDLIITKSPIVSVLRTMKKCPPIYFFVGGIYTNSLQDYVHDGGLQSEIHSQFLNVNLIQHLQKSDKVFCNSSHTQRLLLDEFGMACFLFYSTFVPFYGQSLPLPNTVNIAERPYTYGIVVSNVHRSIKNVSTSISHVKNTEHNLLLIGKDSCIYQHLPNITCIDRIVNHEDMPQFYKQIKYIVQDSYYESCSNVMVEALFYGCRKIKKVVVSSTQYPGYGGAATNAYKLIKYFRSEGVRVAGFFLHTSRHVNYDPENIGGIFMFDYKDHDSLIRSLVLNYLGGYPDICLAKNYVAPVYCKRIFYRFCVYLVSGINHMQMFYQDKSATEVLKEEFTIDTVQHVIPQEKKCLEVCDAIVFNSMLSKKLFEKIYQDESDIHAKIYQDPIDTSIECQQHDVDPHGKDIDILLCASSFIRPVKNNLFLIDILKQDRFKNYKKCVIGEHHEAFLAIPNSTCMGLISNQNVLQYMKKSKMLLFPSLFDANSNTVKEAYYCQCLPLITRNIGYHEIFPEVLICDTFDEKEWTLKIQYVLDHYQELVKTISIDYHYEDIDKLLDMRKYIGNEKKIIESPCLRKLAVTDNPYQYMKLLDQLSVSSFPPPIVNHHLSWHDVVNGLNDRHEVWVIVDHHGTIIGSGTLLVEQKVLHHFGRVGHIEDIVVDHQHRGKGYGKRIVDHLMSRAFEHQCYKVILNCKDSLVKFYETCGFQRNEQQMAYYLTK